MMYKAVVALVAFAGFSAAQVYDDGTEPNCPTARTFCSTDSISPIQDDCARALDYLTNTQKTKCIPQQSVDTGCRRVASYGTCAIEVCGKQNGYLRYFTGDEVAKGIFYMAGHCNRNGRIGGYHMFDDKLGSGCGANSADSCSDVGSAGGYGVVQVVRIY